MSGHTKGPWLNSARVERGQADRSVVARAFDGSLTNICDKVRGGSPDEADANVRLIAAAPDLLAALKAVLAGFDEGVFVRNIADDDKSDWAIRAFPHIAALAKAVKAIEKAEGERPHGESK